MWTPCAYACICMASPLHVITVAREVCGSQGQDGVHCNGQGRQVPDTGPACPAPCIGHTKRVRVRHTRAGAPNDIASIVSSAKGPRGDPSLEVRIGQERNPGQGHRGGSRRAPRSICTMPRRRGSTRQSDLTDPTAATPMKFSDLSAGSMPWKALERGSPISHPLLPYPAKGQKEKPNRTELVSPFRLRMCSRRVYK